VRRERNFSADPPPDEHLGRRGSDRRDSKPPSEYRKRYREA